MAPGSWFVAGLGPGPGSSLQVHGWWCKANGTRLMAQGSRPLACWLAGWDNRIGLMACCLVGFLLFGFRFAKLFCWNESFFSNRCDFKSRRGHVWCPKLVFVSQVFPFWHPEHHFESLGSLARKCTLGSGAGPLLISGGLRDPTKLVSFFHACFQFVFLRIFWFDFNRMELGKEAFGIRTVALEFSCA